MRCEYQIKNLHRGQGVCYNFGMDAKTPEYGTIAHLIELAIQGERVTEAFYKRLSAKFSSHPEIERFWLEYAAEENGHARWLEGLRKRVPAEQLEQYADPVMLEEAERAITVPIDNLVRSIRTLQDAYEVANELEHSETNTVFDFLIGHFAEDPQTQNFLRAQLNEHIGRLIIQFPRQYGTGSLRRGIEARQE